MALVDLLALVGGQGKIKDTNYQVIRTRLSAVVPTLSVAKGRASALDGNVG